MLALVIFLILKEPTSLDKETSWNKNLDSIGQPEEKEDDLDAADDGEPGEEPHGAPNEAELGLELDGFVALNLVKGGRVKVNLHQMKFWLQLLP